MAKDFGSWGFPKNLGIVATQVFKFLVVMHRRLFDWVLY